MIVQKALSAQYPRQLNRGAVPTEHRSLYPSSKMIISGCKALTLAISNVNVLDTVLPSIARKETSTDDIKVKVRDRSSVLTLIKKYIETTDKGVPQNKDFACISHGSK